MRHLGLGVLIASLAASLAACYVPLGTPTTIAGSPVPGAPGAVGPQGQAGALQATTSVVEISLGEERNLTTLLRDQTGQAPTALLNWLSSNPGIVTVNPISGQVKAAAPGTAVLTASIQATPSVQAKIEVRVVTKDAVNNITIEPQTPTIAVGDRLKLVPSVQMANGTINGNVTWSSSDETLAKVNATTGEVSALKEGRVTIIGAYAPDTKFKGVAALTIVKDRSLIPSAQPSDVMFVPSAAPTAQPTAASATAAPTATPTASPSPSPTPEPSASPTPTPEPTGTPAATPTPDPT